MEQRCGGGEGRNYSEVQRGERGVGAASLAPPARYAHMENKRESAGGSNMGTRWFRSYKSSEGDKEEYHGFQAAGARAKTSWVNR